MDKNDVWEGLDALASMVNAQKAVIYALIDTHPDPGALLERYEGYVPTVLEYDASAPKDVQERTEGHVNEWRMAIRRKMT